jgi:UDP:flavonoid glycosyltransferase YjiC (YdhE family)
MQWMQQVGQNHLPDEWGARLSLDPPHPQSRRLAWLEGDVMYFRTYVQQQIEIPLLGAEKVSPHQIGDATLEALRDMGVRAVVSTFAPPPASLPEWARSGPGRQDELLRESSVLVCGGGHGMLVKALRAAVPVVVVPGGGDQWEMANRVARQGSGLIVRPATVDGLREAVRRVLDDPGFAAAASVAADATDVRDPVEVCRAAVDPLPEGAST